MLATDSHETIARYAELMKCSFEEVVNFRTELLAHREKLMALFKGFGEMNPDHIANPEQMMRDAVLNGIDESNPIAQLFKAREDQGLRAQSLGLGFLSYTIATIGKMFRYHAAKKIDGFNSAENTKLKKKWDKSFFPYLGYSRSYIASSFKSFRYDSLWKTKRFWFWLIFTMPAYFASRGAFSLKPASASDQIKFVEGVLKNESFFPEVSVKKRRWLAFKLLKAQQILLAIAPEFVEKTFWIVGKNTVNYEQNEISKEFIKTFAQTIGSSFIAELGNKVFEYRLGAFLAQRGLIDDKAVNFNLSSLAGAFFKTMFRSLYLFSSKVPGGKFILKTPFLPVFESELEDVFSQMVIHVAPKLKEDFVSSDKDLNFLGKIKHGFNVVKDDKFLTRVKELANEECIPVEDFDQDGKTLIARNESLQAVTSKALKRAATTAAGYQLSDVVSVRGIKPLVRKIINNLARKNKEQGKMKGSSLSVKEDLLQGLSTLSLLFRIKHLVVALLSSPDAQQALFSLQSKILAGDFSFLYEGSCSNEVILAKAYKSCGRQVMLSALKTWSKTKDFWAKPNQSVSYVSILFRVLEVVLFEIEVAKEAQKKIFVQQNNFGTSEYAKNIG